MLLHLYKSLIYCNNNDYKFIILKKTILNVSSRDEKYNNLFYDSAIIENMNIQKKKYIKQWLRYRKNRRAKRERKRSIEKLTDKDFQRFLSR